MVFSNYICLICVSQWSHGSQKFIFEFMCMLVIVWEELQPVSTSSVRTSPFFMSEKHIFQDTGWIWSPSVLYLRIPLLEISNETISTDPLHSTCSQGACCAFHPPWIRPTETTALHVRIGYCCSARLYAHTASLNLRPKTIERSKNTKKSIWQSKKSINTIEIIHKKHEHISATMQKITEDHHAINSYRHRWNPCITGENPNVANTVQTCGFSSEMPQIARQWDIFALKCSK